MEWENIISTLFFILASFILPISLFDKELYQSINAIKSNYAFVNLSCPNCYLDLSRKFVFLHDKVIDVPKDDELLKLKCPYCDAEIEKRLNPKIDFNLIIKKRNLFPTNREKVDSFYRGIHDEVERRELIFKSYKGQKNKKFKLRR